MRKAPKTFHTSKGFSNLRVEVSSAGAEFMLLLHPNIQKA